MSSWSMSEQQEIQHFSHIHPLTKVDGCGEFTCDGCKTHGYGKTYHCSCCNYKLHDHCAMCPPNLCSFLHPFHELRLEQTTHQSEHMCNICDESVEGLYYHCEECRFSIHPLCTRLPQHVKSVHHPDHLLVLSHLGPKNTCMACHSAIRSWRYKCFICGTDIHMECINSFASSTKTQSDHVHQDKVHKPSKTRKMLRLAKDVSVGVVSNLFSSPISETIAGLL